jgi:hypothetical protein
MSGIGYCVAIGNYAMQSNDNVRHSVAIGVGAGQNWNPVAAAIHEGGAVFIGSNAGGTCTLGQGTIAIGRNAMFGQTQTGHNNIAIGARSSEYITSGENNVAMGTMSGYRVSTGDGNTNIGHLSGYAHNPAVGTSTGNNNSCIGGWSTPASPSSSNSFTLGSGVQTLRCGTTSITSISDRRDKSEIVDCPYGVDFLSNVRPVKFKWAMRDLYPTDNDDAPLLNTKDGEIELGFIAQELQEVEVNAGSVDETDLVYDDNPDRLEASPNKLIPILVQAIKELTARLEALENA